MDPSVDSWSLPALVVEKIVSRLKETRRWRMDGPSLRLINKRWSSAIDQHIVQVRPHFDRVLVPDVKSLLKFPLLTSVDVQPFLTRSVTAARAQSTDELEYYRNRSRIFEEDIERIVDVLIQLPDFSHLEVESNIISSSCFRYNNARKHWSKLRSVASLHVYNNINPKLYGEGPMNTFWPLQRKRSLSRDFLKELASFIAVFPDLRSLEMRLHHKELILPEDLCLLEKVNVLKLQAVGPSEFVSALCCQTAIEGVALLGGRLTTLDCLLPFEHLETLSVALRFPLSLQDSTTVDVFKRLTVLSLSGNDYYLIAGDTFNVLDRLRCLSLSCVSFYGASFKGNLPNLEALHLSTCMVKDECLSFLSGMRNLRCLSLSLIINARRRLMDVFSPDLMLPNIRALHITPVSDNRAVAFIARLTQLEVLSLYLEHNVTTDGFIELESLPELRVLGICDPRYGKEIVELFSINLLSKLERLYLVHYPDQDAHVQEKLREKAPRIILEWGESRLSRLHKSHLI